MIGAAPAKINLALVVGPLRDDDKHDLVTVFQRVDLGDRISVEPAVETTVEGFAEDTIVRLALDRASPRRTAGASGSTSGSRRRRARRRQLRRGHGAPPRECAARAAARARRARRAGRWHRLRRAVLPRRRASARDRRRGTARAARPAAGLRRPAAAAEGRAEALDRSGLRGVRPARGRGRFRGARRPPALGARRHAPAARPRRAAAERPRELAARGELRALGAFRADVSGAGPVVYAPLPSPGRRTRPPRRAFRGRRTAWITVPAWYG